MCVSSNRSMPVSSFRRVHRDVATEAQQPPLKVFGRRSPALLLRDERVLSRPVVCTGSTREDLIAGANRDVVRLYLKSGARHQSDPSDGQNSRCSCLFFCLFFFLIQFSIRQPNSLLSRPLAHWNGVTDISYTRFLTSVHRGIQPAQAHAARLPSQRRHPLPHPPTSSILAQATSTVIFLQSPGALIRFGIPVPIHPVGL